MHLQALRSLRDVTSSNRKSSVLKPQCLLDVPKGKHCPRELLTVPNMHKTNGPGGSLENADLGCELSVPQVLSPPPSLSSEGSVLGELCPL